MRILGLDLSLTSTGAAVVEDGRVAFMAAVSPAKLPPHATPAQTTERLSIITDWLGALISKSRPQVVAIEGYSYASAISQAHSIGELGGAVRLWLWRNRYRDIVEWPPKQWRKYLFDDGNLAKEMVRIRVAKRFGDVVGDRVETATLDELEAWCVAHSEWIRRSEGAAGPPAKMERAPRPRKKAVA